MKKQVVLAGDQFVFSREIVQSIEKEGFNVTHVASMNECLELLLIRDTALLVVSAMMNQAFSLMRIVKKNARTNHLPIVVISTPGQEGLIEKHRQLPNRANRYLTAPISEASFMATIRELVQQDGEESDQDQGFQDDGGSQQIFEKLRSELKTAQKELRNTQADYEAAVEAAREQALLRQENMALKKRLKTYVDQDRSTNEYNSIFKRLEDGYKTTIAELERLVGEKDRLLIDIRQQLPPLDGEGGPAAAAALKKIEAQHAKVRAMREMAARAIDLLSAMDAPIDGMSPEEWLDLAVQEEDIPDLGFREDEATQLLDLDNVEDLLK